MSRLGTITAAALASFLCMAPGHAQSRRVYLPTAGDDDLERFESLRAALASPDPDSTQIADLVCELLVAGGEHSTRNGLVATSERQHRGLRAQIVDLLPSLSDEVSKKVRAFQQRAATQALRREEPPQSAELLRRFPASTLGAEAAELLWQRAFEAGDRAQCWALSRLLSKLHPERVKTPGAQTLLAHLNAWPRAGGQGVATTRGPSARLVVSKVLPLAEPSPGHPGTHSPSFPLLAANRVCVSNGARLKIFDLEGELRGAIPAHAAAASEAPSTSTLFQARLAQWGGKVFSPLVLERWLAPARKRAKEDGSLSDRYYTLLAFDPQKGRILWWDGDSGPSTVPVKSGSDVAGSPAPGLKRLEPKLKRSLDLGHVIAVAADASRVYVAITRAGQEPQLALMAFRRDTGDAQPFVLRPAWSMPTHLLAAEPTERSADTRPIAAEIAASLALDGRGQLVCTTDLGLAACVDTRSGDLLWTVQDRQDKGQAGELSQPARTDRSRWAPRSS